MPSQRGCGIAKNRKIAEIPLIPWLADILRQERQDQAKHFGKHIGGRDRVFPWMPTDSHALPRQIRKDAVKAELPLEDDEGRVLDFHALRGSCATILLGEGLDAHIVQQIMRHSSIEMTMRHYTKVRRTDLHSAVRSIRLPPEDAGETRISTCSRKSVCTRAMDTLASLARTCPGGGIGRRARFRS